MTWWTSCTGSASRTRPRTTVYDALTTIDGLSGWWASDTAGNARSAE